MTVTPMSITSAVLRDGSVQGFPLLLDPSVPTDVKRERAGIWLRVSTKAQDEESQLPDDVRWCETHNYDVPEDCVYVLPGYSAYRGSPKFDRMWARVLDDFRLRKITVLVMWLQDRLDRKLQTLRMLAEVMEVGGRVEFVKQPWLNDLTSMSGRISLKVQEEIAYEESRIKTERINNKFGEKREAGSLIGRRCWGYRIGCKDCGEACVKGTKCHSGRKTLYPTDEGRKYIPIIFQMVIDGRSLVYIAKWLDSEGVKTMSGRRWSEGYLGHKLLKNPTYYGKRPNSGNLEVEPLIPVSTWQQAQLALATRIKPGRRKTKGPEALVSLQCGNPDCDATGSDHDSPMYRKTSGPRDGTYLYFECRGRGPQRKGCGAPGVRAERLEESVCDAMLNDDRPHIERVFYAGDDVADRIAAVRERGAVAMRNGDMDQVQLIMQEVRDFESLPHVEPHWEDRALCEECGQVAADVVAQCLADGHHVRMVGEHFASLDRDQRRDYLQQYQIRAWLDPDRDLMLSIVHRSLVVN
jgi:DNA invertase Pin-like site-specific DNA recombinase